MPRLATAQDRDALRALWQRVFGDDEEYIDRCLDSFAGPGQVYVEGEPGAAWAQLLAVPCALGERQGVYLYALATDPEKRGQGTMTELMDYAQRQEAAKGAQFACLIPANAPLFDYYRKRGYSQDIELRLVEHMAGRKTAPVGPVAVGAPTAGKLQKLRARWLEMPSVAFAGQRAALVCEDAAAGGALLWQCGKGYAVSLPSEGKALVAELAAVDDVTAVGLLNAICGETGMLMAQASLPAHSRLFAGRGQVVPAALARPLVADFALPANLYLRFALDEPQEVFAAVRS